MTQRGRFWLRIAKISVVLNAIFAAVALFQGEMFHAASHVALMIFSALWVWLLKPTTSRQATRELAETDAALDHLQQSLDAIALNVERIGESQRFITSKVQGDTVKVERQG